MKGWHPWEKARMGTHSYQGNNPPTEVDCQRFGYDEGARYARVFVVRDDADITAKTELAMIFAENVDIVRLNGPRMIMSYVRGFINGLDEIAGGKPTTLEEKLDRMIDLLGDATKDGRVLGPAARKGANATLDK